MPQSMLLGGVRYSFDRILEEPARGPQLDAWAGAINNIVNDIVGGTGLTIPEGGALTFASATNPTLSIIDDTAINVDGDGSGNGDLGATTSMNIYAGLGTTYSPSISLVKDGAITFSAGAGQVVSAIMDASVTAGETRLRVWSVTANAAVRVTIGAADSGGAGFRLLRVPN